MPKTKARPEPTVLEQQITEALAELRGARLDYTCTRPTRTPSAPWHTPSAGWTCSPIACLLNADVATG
jgi:hypothetical protein